MPQVKRLEPAKAKKQIAAQSQANSEQAMIASAPNIAQVIDSGVGAAQAASEIPGQGQPGLALPMPA